MAITDYLRDEIMDDLENSLVSLHDSDPTSTGIENEISFPQYNRVSTDSSDWDIDGGIITNVQTVKFPVAHENWTTVTHFTIWDNMDNPLFTSELKSPVLIEEGDSGVFREGNLEGTIS